MKGLVQFRMFSRSVLKEAAEPKESDAKDEVRYLKGQALTLRSLKVDLFLRSTFNEIYF